MLWTHKRVVTAVDELQAPLGSALHTEYRQCGEEP